MDGYSQFGGGAKMPMMMGQQPMQGMPASAAGGGSQWQDLMNRDPRAMGRAAAGIAGQPQTGMPQQPSASNPMYDELARAFMASRLANVSQDPERNTQQMNYANPNRPRTRIPTEVASRYGIDLEQAQRGFRSPQDMFSASSYAQPQSPMSYMK